MSYAFRKIMPALDMPEMEQKKAKPLSLFAKIQQAQIAAEIEQDKTPVLHIPTFPLLYHGPRLVRVTSGGVWQWMPHAWVLHDMLWMEPEHCTEKVAWFRKEWSIWTGIPELQLDLLMKQSEGTPVMELPSVMRAWANRIGLKHRRYFGRDERIDR